MEDNENPAVVEDHPGVEDPEAQDKTKNMGQPQSNSNTQNIRDLVVLFFWSECDSLKQWN